MGPLDRHKKKLELRIDDLLRTGPLPMLRGGAEFIRSMASSKATPRLIGASAWLMHQPNGPLSRAALRQARRSARKSAIVRERSPQVTIIRSFVAKPFVSPEEPGVILVSFESELRKLLSLESWRELHHQYRICFMPSWQNFLAPEVFLLDAIATAPYYIFPSDFAEHALRPLLGLHARILPFHAASWVSHDLYTVDRPRDIDIVMLANFQRLKRHWKLFEALASMPDDLDIQLLGISIAGRTRQDLLDEAAAFGVQDRFTILEDADQPTIRDILSRARLLAALSYREGSYVGVAEAMLAGTPVAMFANAMVGTKRYVNERTGFLLDPHRPLGRQLSSALESFEQKSPRDWAVKNISAAANCRRLNDLLSQDYRSQGLRWTVEITPFHCIRFEFCHSSPQTYLPAEISRLERKFGLILA